MPRKYYSGIDLVRFFAALIVAIHHLGFTAWLGVSNFPAAVIRPGGGAEPVVTSGWALWVGVQIFFVISGVVIAGSAYGRTGAEFARGRALRLYPAVWFCATLTLLIVLAMDVGTSHPVIRWFLSMMISPIGPWIDPVFWTLAVEIMFYLLVFTWLRHPICSLQTLAGLLAVWSAIYLIVVGVTEYSLPPKIERPMLLRHGCFFALGMLLWSWVSGHLKRRQVIWLVIALAASLGEVWMKSLESSHQYFHGLAPQIWLPILLFCVSFIAIVASLWLATTKAPNSFMRAAGLTTYPLYLSHTAVGGLLIWWLLRVGLSPEASLFFGIIGAVLAGYAISKFIEPLIREWAAGALDGIGRRLRSRVDD